MQSSLSKNLKWSARLSDRLAATFTGLRTKVMNRLAMPWGPVTQRRLRRTVLFYASVFVFAFLLQEFSEIQRVQAFATGLMSPGAGFLFWANPLGEWYLVHVGLTLLALMFFAIGVVLWFASGNMVAPVLAWVCAAVGAAMVPAWVPAQVTAVPWPGLVETLRIGIPLLILLAFVTKVERSGKARQRYQRFCEQAPAQPQVSSVPTTPRGSTDDELSLESVQKMRALLDRSLQPVDQFEGFDWIDQFQTAALRYQINFVSYALSVASQVHLPAAQAYMHTAQSNLAHKLLDHRVWGYWVLENMWGNLKTSADPVTRDNIMLSGFLSAQFGLARNLVGLNEFDDPDSLIFKRRNGEEFRYSLAKINSEVAGHYKNADYGLLACEPNWVFPLCNAITATGLRALDTQTGSSDWDTIADRFKQSLETEFMSGSGLLVPFRSSRTGIAAPMIGGGAMQSLPCLFLNSLHPDIAASQWQLCRENLTEASGRRAMWPVDIGNYRFNRSASYGACASTAVEMGDQDTAKRILDYLNEDYPAVLTDGVMHRPKSSLWAHALEFTAIAGDHNALQKATTVVNEAGPVIAQVSYPDVLLASAKSKDGCLRAVLYPGADAGKKSVTLGGLKPDNSYSIDADETRQVVADHAGNATVNIIVDGRTELDLKPRQ